MLRVSAALVYRSNALALFTSPPPPDAYMSPVLKKRKKT